MASVAERLGAGPDARLLILNCADLGFCHASSTGVYAALRSGLATSASLLVPAPWAREAAARFRGDDVGVPITQAPSLLDGDGGFPRTVTDIWEHADIDEVRRECRAQVERAVLWGFDISHLEAHMDALVLRPEFFDVYLELALDFGLPLRLPDTAVEPTVGFPVRRLAAEEGVLFADRSFTVPARGGRGVLLGLLSSLEPGVTEITLHPAVDTAELRAASADWESRAGDLSLLTDDVEVAAAVAGAGVTTIGYRPLREAMRSTALT
jgi:predicted glycoside hydrolase/deacetylase ChbG (UPF0249 family)